MATLRPQKWWISLLCLKRCTGIRAPGLEGRRDCVLFQFPVLGATSSSIMPRKARTDPMLLLQGVQWNAMNGEPPSLHQRHLLKGSAFSVGLGGVCLSQRRTLNTNSFSLNEKHQTLYTFILGKGSVQQCYLPPLVTVKQGGQLQLWKAAAEVPSVVVAGAWIAEGYLLLCQTKCLHADGADI